MVKGRPRYLPEWWMARRNRWVRPVSHVFYSQRNTVSFNGVYSAGKVRQHEQ